MKILAPNGTIHLNIISNITFDVYRINASITTSNQTFQLLQMKMSIWHSSINVLIQKCIVRQKLGLLKINGNANWCRVCIICNVSMNYIKIVRSITIVLHIHLSAWLHSCCYCIPKEIIANSIWSFNVSSAIERILKIYELMNNKNLA